MPLHVYIPTHAYSDGAQCIVGVEVLLPFFIFIYLFLLQPFLSYSCSADLKKKGKELLLNPHLASGDLPL